MNTFGERLKQLRKERKLTQTQLAEALGTTQSTIYKMEHDLLNASLNQAHDISKALGVSLDYLVGKEIKVEPATEPLPLWIKLIKEYNLTENEIKELLNYVGYIISKR